LRLCAFAFSLGREGDLHPWSCAPLRSFSLLRLCVSALSLDLVGFAFVLLLFAL